MTSTSPQKRRATAFRSNTLEQPMRRTRSMARISDAMDFSEPSSMSRLSEQRESASSSQTRITSSRRPRASQAVQLESFDSDSPDVSMAVCMESPKKGRFDDFEFELENSVPEVPTRRRRIAPPSQSSTSSSTHAGLPRSKTSSTSNRSTTPNTLLTSRKENSPTAQTEHTKAGTSPIKPVATLARASILHGPTPTARTSSQTADLKSQSSTSTDHKAPFAVGVPAAKAARRSLEGKTDINQSSSHRLLFNSSFVSSTTSAKRDAFQESNQASSLAMLGEPRHSPVKRFQPKSEFIISSLDRPDQKPINLLDLKPSPGKAQRGIFRHNSALDEEEEDDDWDESASNTVDEIRLVRGPLPKKEVPAGKREQNACSSESVNSSDSFSSSSRKAVNGSGSVVDVKHTLSTETSDALASLEASLAKLKAKTRSLPNAAAASKDKHDISDTNLTRELGTTRLPSLASSRTQLFGSKAATAGNLSVTARSAADQSGDSSVFKRPAGRVSALAKSRESSSDVRSKLNPSLASSKSMIAFGAPRLPRYSELGGRVSKPGLAGSRTSSLDMGSDDSRFEEQVAREEEEARAAETKRLAELTAAKRRSMSSILSSGVQPPLQRMGTETTNASMTSTSKPSPASNATVTLENAAGESSEARKVAKTVRRRSMFAYPPAGVKREDAEGDRSIGNLSTGLVISSSTAGASEGDTSGVKKARFLRGLTVLVDVRDQDGEDASACWVEMLKSAGAKVMVRFGERKLTHIVYKSGRPSTLHSYRALEEPKPHVVGISWVVACLEQAKKADETPYLVEVGKQAIFTHRRRSSMAPKQAPSSATSIRELPKELLKDVEQARKKLLIHAPAVPSPLRRRVSSRTILASRLAQTWLHSEPDDDLYSTLHAKNSSSNAGTMTNKVDTDDETEEWEGAEDLETYRARVESVLSSQLATVLA